MNVDSHDKTSINQQGRKEFGSTKDIYEDGPIVEYMRTKELTSEVASKERNVILQ